MKKLLIVAVASLASYLVAGCTGWVDDQGNPLSVSDINQALDEFNSGMAPIHQSIQDTARVYPTYTPGPAIGSYSQPNSTDTFLCRDMTDQLISCRQLN